MMFEILRLMLSEWLQKAEKVQHNLQYYVI